MPRLHADTDARWSSCLHGTVDETVDHVPLQDDEDDDDRYDQYDRTGHHYALVGAEGAVHRQVPERGGVVVLQKRRADQELVPRIQPDDDRDGDEPWRDDRQHHQPQRLPGQGPIHLRGRLQLNRDVQEKRAHQKDRERHVHRGDDRADGEDVAEQVQFGEADVERKQEQLDRYGHRDHEVDDDRRL